MAQSNRKRKPVAQTAQVEPDAPGPHDRIWRGLIGLGILLRIALACVSIGTNDAASWLRFGEKINQNGLMFTYSNDPDFNHPPFPGYWSAVCAKLAGSDDLPFHDSLFTILFKIVPILGDCLGVYVLYLIWSRRRGRSFGLAAGAMFALSLDAIAVSAYHCNTDSLLIALCLLCLYLLRDRPLLSGLALAAAINVKIIPVLLIPVLLLQLRHRRDAVRFLAGLAVGVIPFIPPLIAVPGPFLHNAVQYNSALDRWGINYFLLHGDRAFVPSHMGEKIATVYYSNARYLILSLIGLWAIVARLKPRWTIYEAAFIPYAIFLIFAPGFGVQYTVLTGLFLFAMNLRWGIVYGALAGLFISAAYFVFCKWTFPLYSQWGSLLPEPVALVGLATWFLLIYFAIRLLIRTREYPSIVPF